MSPRISEQRSRTISACIKIRTKMRILPRRWIWPLSLLGPSSHFLTDTTSQLVGPNIQFMTYASCWDCNGVFSLKQVPEEEIEEDIIDEDIEGEGSESGSSPRREKHAAPKPERSGSPHHVTSKDMHGVPPGWGEFLLRTSSWYYWCGFFVCAFIFSWSQVSANHYEVTGL